MDLSANSAERRGRSFSRRESLGAAAFALTPGLAKAAAPPRRVVSLNPCLDAILVQVADPRQIAALSHYARDPHGSTIAEIARRFPITHESAEEVLLLRPDLVLASVHTALATRAAMQRAGLHVELFNVPDTVADSLAQVERIAALVGRPARGAALEAQIASALARAAPPPGARPIPALIFQARGFAAGAGTLADEMLRRTGYENVAARYSLQKWGDVRLEQLIFDPPAVLFAGEVSPGTPTWADRVLTHPALRSVAHCMRRATFPERLLYCGGPALISSAAVMAAARPKAAR